MVAPPELVANSCLVVMGSEGRADQVLRTDQDNGLICATASKARAWTGSRRNSPTVCSPSAIRPVQAASW